MDEKDETKADRDRSTLIKLVVIVIALLIGLLIGELWPLVGSSPNWEYSIESPPDSKLQERLDQLGAAGWELVFARRATGDTSEGSSAQYEMILKRRKTKQF
jgi:hypothetical protein